MSYLMRYSNFKWKAFLTALLFTSYSYAQEGEIHGDFQLNLQSYKDDARVEQ